MMWTGRGAAKTAWRGFGTVWRIAPALVVGLLLCGPAAAQTASPLPNGRPPAAVVSPTVAGSSSSLIQDDPGEANADDDSGPPDTTGGNQLPPAETLPTLDHPLGSVGLDLALKLIASRDFAGATLAAYALPNKVDVKIVDWLIAISGDPQVPSSRIADVSKRLSDWPGQALLHLRFEQAIAREKPSSADVITALGGTKPTSEEAAIVLARAYRDAGRDGDAGAVIRDLWSRTSLSAAAEKTILAEFSGLLLPADHQGRMDSLLYAGMSDAALRTAMQLDPDQQALAQAVVATIKGQSTAQKLLDALPATVKNDPVAIYSRVQVLRRANRIHDAAMLLVSAAPSDPKALVNPDAWWVERRLISRDLIDAGDPKLAYQIAAGHVGESPALRAEAEFHAGWYALEFLHDPKTAMTHFAAIATASSTPLSASRSEYWLGRAATAAGDKAGGATHYQKAATYPTTYYGELALAKLGQPNAGLAAPPAADTDTAARFNGRELVQAIQHLTTEGVTDEIALFYRSLASSLTDPAELALLAKLADDNGEHELALQVGVTAATRFSGDAALAFPIAAIPDSAATPTVERSLVFSVARQESSFDVSAASAAGAFGLLQLLPSTAKASARKLGVAYSQDRLTSDAGYNATLGAVYLGSLVGDFNGSYVLGLAAYNAGAARVADWIKKYGDPRDPKVDVVDWIERIPYTETRNYVERVMENLEPYRSRLGAPPTSIEADLKRGGKG
jgi:soluble lytic murein transglycosylase